MATEAELKQTIDPFLLKTASIRSKLDASFTEYQQDLQERKLAITGELDRTEAEYKASRGEYCEKRKVLDQIKSTVKQQCETFKTMESTLLSEVEKQIALLEREYPEKEIDLVLDSTFTERIQRLGELELKILDKATDEAVPSSLVKIPEQSSNPEVKEGTELPTTPRDFTQLKKPILCAVKQGDGSSDLKYPQRVTIDPQTGIIFIADQTSHCVKLFSQEGLYKGSVQHNSSIRRSGLGVNYELVHPFGVCFYQNSLYVTSLLEKSFGTDLQPCIFRFDRVGGSETKFQYSMSAGSRGSDAGQFNRPRSIRADKANGDVFVCDDEKRIQVLDKNLNYKRLLSVPGGCTDATDIQVIGNNLYLLKSDGKSIYECEKQGTSLRIALGISAASQFIVHSLQGPRFIFNNGRTLYFGEKIHEKPPTDYRYTIGYAEKYSSKELNSINLGNNPADDGRFEIRGIAFDESTQRIILVLHSKDRMLQIF